MSFSINLINIIMRKTRCFLIYDPFWNALFIRVFLG